METYLGKMSSSQKRLVLQRLQTYFEKYSIWWICSSYRIKPIDISKVFLTLPKLLIVCNLQIIILCQTDVFHEKTFLKNFT